MSVHTWYKDTIGEKAVEALKKNNFDAVYFADRGQAVAHVLNYIEAKATVGFGGSMTLAELGIPEQVKAKGAVILNHNLPELSPAEKLEIRRRQLTSDVFLCSTNALTLDGYLVNIDGMGNRVAALTFGPKKVIVVAGVNKICQDVHRAYERIRLIAAPKNNKRLGYENPCTVSGTCADCQSKNRICNVYSVIKKKPLAADITVVVIGEELGY